MRFRVETKRPLTTRRNMNLGFLHKAPVRATGLFPNDIGVILSCVSITKVGCNNRPRSIIQLGLTERLPFPICGSPQPSLRPY